MMIRDTRRPTIKKYRFCLPIIELFPVYLSSVGKMFGSLLFFFFSVAILYFFQFAIVTVQNLPEKKRIPVQINRFSKWCLCYVSFFFSLVRFQRFSILSIKFSGSLSIRYSPNELNGKKWQKKKIEWKRERDRERKREQNGKRWLKQQQLKTNK